MSQIVTITDGALTARIKCHGAELCSLTGPSGIEAIWQAGAAWPRHAPILFPIVGRLAGDRLRYDGEQYVLTQHGFARDLSFAVVEHALARAHFILTDSAATRTRYPFSFRLDIVYQIENGFLSIDYGIFNPGTVTLPVSIGAHPAFNWPLVPGIAKTDHQLEFSNPEPATIRRLKDGLLDPAPEPTPIRGRILDLDEALFENDAMILDKLASRWVRLTAPGAAPVLVAWKGFNTLGLWSRSGGQFLCIEPWRGFASPIGFDDSFALKPGLLHIAPGETRTVFHAIALGEAAGDALIARGDSR
jgi:galactose mutarotase-like enzyme